jgi:hypothetical protein
MPKMRRPDIGERDQNQQTQEGVLQHASLLDAGTLRRSSPWPFKWTLQDNRWYVNRARRTRQTPKDHYEDALM